MGKTYTAYVLFHLKFAVKVGETSIAVGAAHRGIDEVGDLRLPCYICECHPLTDLTLVAGLEELLYRKHPMDSIESPIYGGAIVEIPLYDLGAPPGKFPRLWLLGIAGQSPYPKAVPQQRSGHRTTLVARGPAHQDHTFSHPLLLSSLVLYISGDL
jgi:hypothetical protein